MLSSSRAAQQAGSELHAQYVQCRSITGTTTSFLLLVVVSVMLWNDFNCWLLH
jgi:hypothetical protein